MRQRKNMQYQKTNDAQIKNRIIIYHQNSDVIVTYDTLILLCHCESSFALTLLLLYQHILGGCGVRF